MEKLIQKGSKDLPYFDFDNETGLLKMGGISIPENVNEVFEPVRNWLLDYMKSPCELTRIEMYFEYVNTATAKALSFIVHLIEKMYSEKINVFIWWAYKHDDIEMLELGEDLLIDSVCPYKIEAVNN